MTRQHGPRFLIGPDGYPFTVDDLPIRPMRRWPIRRKAQVVAAIDGGLLTSEQVCDRYSITREELLAWHSAVADRNTTPRDPHPQSVNS